MDKQGKALDEIRRQNPGKHIPSGAELAAQLRAAPVVDGPPEPDDRAHCRTCGCPVEDAEHDDNGGQCYDCAGVAWPE